MAGFPGSKAARLAVLETPGGRGACQFPPEPLLELPNYSELVGELGCGRLFR